MMDIHTLLTHVGGDVQKQTGQVPCLHQTLHPAAVTLLPPPVGWVPEEPPVKKLRRELEAAQAETARVRAELAQVRAEAAARATAEAAAQAREEAAAHAKRTKAPPALGARVVRERADLSQERGGFVMLCGYRCR